MERVLAPVAANTNEYDDLVRSRFSIQLFTSTAESGAGIPMKHLSAGRREWLKRHALRSAMRKLRERSGKRLRRKYFGALLDGGVKPKLVNLYSNGRTDSALVTGESKSVPSILCLEDNYEETSKFLASLRSSFNEAWRSGSPQGLRNRHRHRGAKAPFILGSFWDFSTIERISPEVALTIASEYDRIRRKNGWVPRAVDIHKWRSDVLVMLHGIGFLSLVGIEPNTGPTVEGKTWRILRFQRGEDVSGEKVAALLDALGVSGIVDDPDLYDAILEALTNIRHHAYEGHSFPEPHVPDWWLTGFVDDVQRRVCISVLDHGCTIPVSLPTWERYPKLQRAFMRLYREQIDVSDTRRDGETIALAMRIGQSATKKHFRGRGLPAIERAIDLCRRGRLAIYSRCGCYIRQTGMKPSIETRNSAFGGTLITWDLEL